MERHGGAVVVERGLVDAIEVGRPRVHRGEDGRVHVALSVHGTGSEPVAVEVQVEFLDACGRAFGDSTTRRVVRIPRCQRTLVRAVSARASASTARVRIWRAGSCGRSLAWPGREPDRRGRGRPK